MIFQLLLFNSFFCVTPYDLKIDMYEQIFDRFYLWISIELINYRFHYEFK